MKYSHDHRPATDDKPEEFIAWVCSDLSCPEWGPANDTPKFCSEGHKVRQRTLKLVPLADAHLVDEEKQEIALRKKLESIGISAAYADDTETERAIARIESFIPGNYSTLAKQFR